MVFHFVNGVTVSFLDVLWIFTFSLNIYKKLKYEIVYVNCSQNSLRLVYAIPQLYRSAGTKTQPYRASVHT